jgi:hypothetical protein
MAMAVIADGVDGANVSVVAGGGVVALTLVEYPERFPAASAARNLYLYVVFAVRPLSE